MTHPALQPWEARGVRLRTRVIKAGTYEGMTPRGRVSDALVHHHATLARHRVGLTLVAYGAVAPEGRTFSDQLLLDAGAHAGLTRLTEAVHDHGGHVGVQLAHAGGFSKMQTPWGPSAAWNPYGVLKGFPRVRAMDVHRIGHTIASFAAAAHRAAAAGMDAVEVHCGHGYLISQFLSPVFNRRRDRWGGDLAGRARLAREVVRAVREAVPDTLVLVKLNTRDGVRGGLEVEESAQVARWLVEDGADLIVPSGGLVQRNAFFLLRGDVPLDGMIRAEKDPRQRLALRLAAPLWIRREPYHPLFFRRDARILRDACGGATALLGGIEGGEDMAAAIGEGFKAVVLGRALLADPDLVARLRRDPDVRTRCDRCNECVAEMDLGGVRCVLGDAPRR